MGLAEGKTAQKIVKKLNRLCRKNRYHIGTGFLTTWRVLQVLSDYGFSETAWRMLTQEDCPGWIYELDKGATTTWENWMGIDENNVPTDSQNHYAAGAAISWLFSHVSGIRPAEPGFAKVRIAPVPAGNLTWAECSIETVHGRVRSSWRRNGDRFQLTVSLPDGVTGKIRLPDGSEHTISGCAKLNCSLKKR